jgi:hypothetical protein
VRGGVCTVCSQKERVCGMKAGAMSVDQFLEERQKRINGLPRVRFKAQPVRPLMQREEIEENF